jgi:hypothetical protein
MTHTEHYIAVTFQIILQEQHIKTENIINIILSIYQ